MLIDTGVCRKPEFKSRLLYSFTMKKLNLLDFKSLVIENPSKLVGGNTRSNGHKTRSSGADEDDATSDTDHPAETEQ